MKKFLSIFTFVALIASCAKAEISEDKIYLFYSKHCGYCHVAMDYIAKAHPKLEVEMVDVGNRDGYDLLLACAEKHELGNRIGTPLFCIGKNYMMGWSKESEKTFDNHVKNFKK